MLSIGLDIGSTTIKIVVLDENENVSLTYRIKLTFSIVNNKYVINSVVVY